MSMISEQVKKLRQYAGERKGEISDMCRAAADTIEMLSEKARPREWISVEERLPETNDEVITTYIVNGNYKKRYVETASYFDGDEGSWSSVWDEYRKPGTRNEVIAWMPLPAPYRAESEEA